MLNKIYRNVTHESVQMMHKSNIQKCKVIYKYNTKRTKMLHKCYIPKLHKVAQKLHKCYTQNLHKLLNILYSLLQKKVTQIVKHVSHCIDVSINKITSIVTLTFHYYFILFTLNFTNNAGFVTQIQILLLHFTRILYKKMFHK